MIIYENIPLNLNPIAFEIGSFAIRWYSIGYLLAFISVLILVAWRIKKGEFDKKELPSGRIQEIFLDVFFASILGMIIGARFGYFFFYDWQTIFNSFNEVVVPTREGFFGFSFHGGLIGMFTATFFYCKYYKIHFKSIVNLFIPAIPIGLFWGRLGNFLNGELWGTKTSMSWGMYFKNQTSLRHPSQLYEAFGEGVIIFLALWFARNKKWAQNNLLSFFLILYGLIRFLIEFFRYSPEDQIILNFLTTGQALCLIMILAGFLLFKKIK